MPSPAVTIDTSLVPDLVVDRPDRLVGRTVVIDFELSGEDLSLLVLDHHQSRDLASPKEGTYESDRTWRFRVAFPPVVASWESRVYYRDRDELGEVSWQELVGSRGVNVTVCHEAPFASSSSKYQVALYGRHLKAIALRKLLQVASPGAAFATESGSIHVAL